MALSTPTQHFGISRFIPYNRTTGIAYGNFRVLQNSSFGVSGELVENRGGSNSWAWEIAEGPLSAELSLSFSEFPAAAYTIFGGNAPTENAAEANGSISDALADFNGTSMTHASNGLSVAVNAGDEDDLKFGSYMVVAPTSTTFDVYYYGADEGRGTDGSFVDDTMKITSSPLAFSGGSVDLADWGLTFTENSSASFTTGDSAKFEVRPANDDSLEVVIGADTDSFPEFGAMLVTKPTNGRALLLDVYRLKAAGLPHNLVANEYAAVELTANAFYDSSKNAVYRVSTVNGLS